MFRASRPAARISPPPSARLLSARLVAAVVMWCGLIVMGRCGRGIASPPRLRFSPLEVFAQCQLQPILPRIRLWSFCRRPRAPVLLVLHRRPVRTGSASITARAENRPVGGLIAGSRDAALKFSANIGKWQLRVIDLIKFDEAGEMTEFEVMIRLIKALQAPGDEMGTGSARNCCG